jgi:hypothetical protein
MIWTIIIFGLLIAVGFLFLNVIITLFITAITGIYMGIEALVKYVIKLIKK